MPNALVVNPDLPVYSVADLIKYAKAKPGSLNLGSPGVGSANHLAGELFKSMAGIDMMHVPYPGAAPAMANLIGGHIQVMFDSLPTVLANAEAGKLRILAVTNSERVSSLPDTPTIAEAVFSRIFCVRMVRPLCAGRSCWRRAHGVGASNEKDNGFRRYGSSF